MRRIKFIIVYTKRGLKVRSKQSLRIIYKNNKNKILKNRRTFVMDIFNSFFFFPKIFLDTLLCPSFFLPS